MSDLATILVRTSRAAIVGELLSTFDTQPERVDVIARLKKANLISDATADMLLEFYSLEGA